MLRLLFFLVLLIWHFYLKFFDHFSTWFDFSIPNNHSIFDFIVVGSGTAGSQIAYRLAEQSNRKVLLLEAGPYAPWFVNIPSMGPFLQQSVFDWEYKTVPQKRACKALKEQRSNWPMGKLVGGTNWFNNLLYVNGVKEDYDQWFPDYKYYNYDRDILYYFHKFEKTLKLTEDIFTTVSNDILKSAGVINLQNNFYKVKATISEKGTRWTTSHTLRITDKPNLKISTKALVTKLLIDQTTNEVRGVEFLNSQNKMVAAWATKAVIVSAGVIGTPKLLQLSGIGPKALLEELRIPIVYDLPVGDNLQDHVTTGIDLIVLDKPKTQLNLKAIFSLSTLYQYLRHGQGPLRSNGCEVTALLKTNMTSKVPDLQLMIIPTGSTVDYGVFFKHIFRINEETWSTYFHKITNNYTISILPVVLHPKSKGHVRIKSNNPRAMPLIDPNYLAEQYDVDILLKGIEVIQKLIETEPMKELGARLVTDKITGCRNHKFNTTEYWTCYVKHLTLTAYHPVGTCKLGPKKDSSSVVDYNFRVQGMSNLYVADASVIPYLPSGNINAAVGMIAEKVADIVLSSHDHDVQPAERSCSLTSIFSLNY